MLTIKNKPLRYSSQRSLPSTPPNLSKTHLNTKTYTFQTDHSSPIFSPSPNKYPHHLLYPPNHKSIKKSLISSTRIDCVMRGCDGQRGKEQLCRRIREQEDKNRRLRGEIEKMKGEHKRKMENMNEIIVKIEQQYDGYDKEIRLLNKKAIQMGL